MLQLAQPIEYVVKPRVDSWLPMVRNLATIADSNTCSLLFSHTNKWTYLCHTVPNISNLLKLLDDILQTKHVPTLIGSSHLVTWSVLCFPCQQKWVDWE